MIKKYTYILLSICLYITQSVEAATVPVHDPSVTIVYKDASGNSYPANDAGGTRTKYYYIFGTQLGAAYSTDMINWTSFTPTFSINGAATTNYYNLIKSEADYAGHTTSNDVRGNLWAPDIIYNKALGKWTLYFSLSGNAFKSSIIMFSSSKIEGNYERVGAVVYGGFTNASTSNARTDYAKVTGSSTVDGRYLDNGGAWDNTYSVSCIDPAVIIDESGKLWMTYGSWSGGIFLIKLSEQTGLRDYNYNYGFGNAPVWNGTRLRYDPYMGIHIGGGYYVSGEGPYIRYIKDANGVGYYYLFVSMGFYSPEGGYTMRVFRSSTIGGIYTDVTGDNAVFDKYVFNYGNNTQYGMPIMQNYKYNWWSMADVAQGHNSVLTDEDGSAYLIYHTKFDNGTAWHNVEVHQLFFNKNGWPLAAPFEFRKNFGLSKMQHSKEEIAGRYNVITHNTVDYVNLKSNAEAEMYINADGTLTGAYTGSWTYSFSSEKQYLTLTTNAGIFEAIVCEQLMDGISTKTIAFTGMNSANERCLWGYKRTNTATINTTNYENQSLLIGDKQYSLAFGDYNSFNKQTVSGDFEIEYTFDNITLAAENWHNWAVAVRTATETWYLRADAFSVGTFTGSIVDHSYTWDWAQFKEIYKNKKVKLKVSRTGTSINIFAYANDVLVYTSTSKKSPTGVVDVYLGGESNYLDVKKISVAKIAAREVVGTTNEDGTYTVPFNSNSGKTTTVSGDFELRYNFNNYHNPTSNDNWDNYLLRVISGGNTMLIRADAYAMDAFGTLTYSYNWDWNKFLAIMSGANVDCIISRSGSTITYKMTITARDGNKYNYQIIHTNAPTTDLSFGFTGEESMQDFFLIEKSNTIAPVPIIAKKYIYNYDNSGNYAWSNTNSWTPKAVPTAIDTVIIRTGEVQINALTHTAPVYVEANGVLRLVTANSTVDKIFMQGGALRVFTSTPELALTSNITVEQPSTIIAGSVPVTVFTLNGTITGNANITKTSVGNLRINSTATGFKGNWIITEGKIQLRSASGLGICGVQVKAGARLDVEVAGASIYSLVIENTGGVDLDQNLNVNVAVFGTENILAGTYKNANYTTYIGSTAALNVSNSLVSLSGPAAFCPGKNVTLTSSSGATYKWLNGTTQVATIAAYTSAVTGSYTVDVTNAAGCKVTSAPVGTTLATAPTATITTPSTSFCTGGSTLLTASAGTSYVWKNGTTQVGTASTYTAATAGAYTLEVTNAAGCKATSTITQITSGTVAIPTITASATSFCTGGSALLTASAGASYKWFNGSNQVGTASTYTAATAGAYTVEVTYTGGCSAISAATQITISAAPVWYQDTDGDGKGNPSATLTDCTKPAGYVSVAGDACPTDPNKTAAGACGCGNLETDTDSDGTPDCTDSDDDNDGATDANDCAPLNASIGAAPVWYQDTDGDGKGNPSVTLTACTQPTGYVSLADDACPTDPNKTIAGACGCGNLETDTDSDGTPDCKDNDDDNDGTPDASDCNPLDANPNATTVWYQDADGDGTGDISASQTACIQPTGYVSVAGDACPADPNKIAAGNCGCNKNETECLDCAGMPNGTAVIDNCNICTGGTTGKTACVPTATINRSGRAHV